MKTFLKFGLVILLLIGCGYYLANQIKTEVSVAPVTRGTAVNAVSSNVTVLSAVAIVEKSLESGRVVEAIFIPGSGSLQVEKGDVLCQLDTEMLDFEINKTKNQLTAAKKRIAAGSSYEYDLENALQDFEHNKKLNEMKQFPDSELKKQERHIEKLKRLIEVEKIDREADLAHHQESLTQLLTRREQTTIRASISGVISESYALVGNYIYAGNAVAKIISARNLIQLSISEEDYPGIDLGQKASIKFLGIADRTFEGTITNLVATANSATKRRVAFVTLDSTPANLLVAGMTGEANITKDIREDTLTIPRRAVFGNYVYVFDELKSEVNIHEVKTGFRDLHTVEILEGVEEGDLVVVKDLHSLNDGARVKLKK